MTRARNIYRPPEWVLRAMGYNTADLAQIFNVPASTIRRWAAEEHWERTVVGGTAWYLFADLDPVQARVQRRTEHATRAH